MGKTAMIVTLLILPIFTAEVLTGSTRLWELANPVALAILVGLYGFGALIIREARARLGLSYAGVLVLGMAYGIVEEGLAVKSFFDPSWPDLDIFGKYGRWAGVNWVWATYLTLFHAVWSITATIALVDALNPDLVNSPFLSNKVLAAATIVFTADVVLINTLITDYQPSPAHYVGALIAVVALTVIGLRIRKRISKTPSPTPTRYGIYWAAWGTSFFLAFYALPTALPAPAASIASASLLAIIALKLCRTADASKTYGYPLYAGATAPILLIVLLQALSPDIERLAVLLLAAAVLAITYRECRKNSLASISNAKRAFRDNH